MIKRALVFLAAVAFAVWAISGRPALAAGTSGCLPAIGAPTGHFPGDSDQTSHGSGEKAAHHHAPCSGHWAAASRIDPAKEVHENAADFSAPGADAWRPLAHGFEELRPPIA